MRSVVKNQAPFWNFMSKIELPIVIFLQKIAFAEKLNDFHNSVASILSTRYLSIYPILLFSLSLNTGVELARSIMLYALLSALSKFTIPRYRPMLYDNVYSYEKVYSSSFPSRHLIGATIIADVIPSTFIRVVLILALMFNRVIMGVHFPSDTIVGFLVGRLCVFLKNRITNPYILTACGMVGLYFWPNGSRVVGSALPILFIPDEWKCKPYSCVIVLLLNFWLSRGRKKLMKKKCNRIVMLLFEIISTSAATIACYYFNLDFLLNKEKKD